MVCYTQKLIRCVEFTDHPWGARARRCRGQVYRRRVGESRRPGTFDTLGTPWLHTPNTVADYHKFAVLDIDRDIDVTTTECDCVIS